MKRKRLILSISTFFLFVSLFLTGYITDKYKTSPKSTVVYYKKPDEVLEMQLKQDYKVQVTIVATGDIMFHNPQLKSALDVKNGEYNFDDMFKLVKKYIEDADLAIGNFETVTAGPEHGFKGYPTFNTPKSAIKTLKDIGFDILSTANNHSLDVGREGLVETIENIQEFGLKNVGTYKEPVKEVLIEDVKGIKVAVMSYTYGCNGLESRLSEEELKYMINFIDEDKIKEDISFAREQADIVVVIIHWGNEYQRKPSEFQLSLAEKMFDWGADIILGSHPHVIQKAELKTINGQVKYVIYSMGNFISNQRYETIKNRYTEDGVIVKICLEKDFVKNNTRIKNVEYIPTWVNRYLSDGKYKYEILPIIDYLNGEVEGITENLLNKLKISYKATMSTINQSKLQ
ncbi:CapA family protein [Caloranaerobacter ferrireducens]|uniref:CapA family protein n=1 Tax=Caloranaerobacter ferrireducens TaxID=1323370 RepID=UPI00084D3959|nr:CapA family protein [Caloranaerobacter ferrireducens]